MIGGEKAIGATRRQRLTARELAIWRSLLDTTAELRGVLGAELQRLVSRPPTIRSCWRYWKQLAQAALVGAGGHHRLGAKSSLPPPWADGATRPHPAR
jgi:hypothetical protein